MYRSVLHGDELKDVSIRTPWRRVERCIDPYELKDVSILTAWRRVERCIDPYCMETS